MVAKEFIPAYRQLLDSGELQTRAEQALQHLHACDLCGRHCGIDRRTQFGACKTGARARVASYGPHHGEEDPLRGWRGSGTIFFSWCNLHCQYCQNSDISQHPAGREVDPQELATIMLTLQASGCHNINFVSPSHVVAQILEALALAAEEGLNLPLVYNTGGFDSSQALSLLDGVVDIYMPDMKYSDRNIARRFSKIGNYPEVNRRAVAEMHRQVGDLVLDRQGVALRGLLIRHLVLPGGLAGTAEVAVFLAEQISLHTYINVMAQYRPAYRAREFPPLDRPVSQEEYRQAVELMHSHGLNRLDQRRPWW